MTTYRPGYVSGKVKMSVYVSPEVHRALRIRAAETGESMGNIVERAIRRALGMERLLRDVQRALELLKRSGIEGWGLSVAPELEEYGEVIETAPAEGCTSETCAHKSHDPAAPTRRWVPHEGFTLIHLGGETLGDETRIDYFALFSGENVIYLKQVDHPYYWSTLDHVDVSRVPVWALASIVEEA